MRRFAFLQCLIVIVCTSLIRFALRRRYNFRIVVFPLLFLFALLLNFIVECQKFLSPKKDQIYHATNNDAEL